MTPLHSTIRISRCRASERMGKDKRIGMRVMAEKVSVTCGRGMHWKCFSVYCTCPCHAEEAAL